MQNIEQPLMCGRVDTLSRSMFVHGLGTREMHEQKTLQATTERKIILNFCPLGQYLSPLLWFNKAFIWSELFSGDGWQELNPGKSVL